jgi:hypothetical protein
MEGPKNNSVAGESYPKSHKETHGTKLSHTRRKRVIIRNHEKVIKQRDDRGSIRRIIWKEPMWNVMSVSRIVKDGCPKLSNDSAINDDENQYKGQRRARPILSTDERATAMADFYEWLGNAPHPSYTLQQDVFPEQSAVLIEPLSIEPVVPNIVDGICVNTNPQITEIADIIDFKRIRPSRKSFYLAKIINGNYYWFHPRRVDRDPRLSKLIGNYRRRSQMGMKIICRKVCGIRKLRNERRIRI